MKTYKASATHLSKGKHYQERNQSKIFPQPFQDIRLYKVTTDTIHNIYHKMVELAEILFWPKCPTKEDAYVLWYVSMGQHTYVKYHSLYSLEKKCPNAVGGGIHCSTAQSQPTRSCSLLSTFQGQPLHALSPSYVYLLLPILWIPYKGSLSHPRQPQFLTFLQAEIMVRNWDGKAEKLD